MPAIRSAPWLPGKTTRQMSSQALAGKLEGWKDAKWCWFKWLVNINNIDIWHHLTCPFILLLPSSLVHLLICKGTMAWKMSMVLWACSAFFMPSSAFPSGRWSVSSGQQQSTTTSATFSDHNKLARQDAWYMYIHVDPWKLSSTGSVRTCENMISQNGLHWSVTVHGGSPQTLSEAQRLVGRAWLPVKPDPGTPEEHRRTVSRPQHAQDKMILSRPLRGKWLMF